MMRPFRVIRAIVRVLKLFIWRFQLLHTEYCNREGAYILCANHTHNMDALPLAFSSKRPVHFLAKKELYNGRFFTAFFRWVGTVMVDRNANDVQSIRQSLKLLRQGEPLAIFPEGTRVYTEDLGEFYEGPILLALRTNTPLIPGGIAGRYRWLHKIVCVWGEPLDLSDLDPQAETSLAIGTQRLKERILALREEARSWL